MTATKRPPHGFPAGYFVVYSLATERFLNVWFNLVADGTEMIVWSEKGKSLDECLPGPDNQVFFIDSSGALCSKSSGHAIDVDGNRLVLRHRKPASFSQDAAHALPTFLYDNETQEIQVFLAPESTPRLLATIPMSAKYGDIEEHFLGGADDHPERMRRVRVLDSRDKEIFGNLGWKWVALPLEDSVSESVKSHITIPP